MNKPYFPIYTLLLLLFISCSEEEPSSGQSSSSYNNYDGTLCEGFAEGTQIEHHGKTKYQFCDVRDGKKYVYVEIGSQTWMAENLNYNASSSRCFGEGWSVLNDETNEFYTITPEEAQEYCETYGRLYNWTTAMAGVCPSGWHLPSHAEWNTLIKFIDPDYNIDYKGDVYNFIYSVVAGKLKAAPGWNRGSSYSKAGTDDYGFTALPGGSAFENNSFQYAGKEGAWWSATEIEDDTRFAYARHMGYNSNDASNNSGRKDWYYSVRCLRN
jgi:uncharacterized protein (TIGR02145 family)